MFKPIDPKPDFPKLEEEILKFWEDNKVFEKSLEQTKTGLPYTFYDGPPFATGTPHYGHILGSTVKDLFPRYQTMKGRLVRRRWGWDCHGLPIEEIVERKLGISGKKDIEKLGIQKFNETCRSMVLEYVKEWRKTVRRIARWVDFDNSYKTMDRDYMESVWWAFKQIYDKGLVYEGRRVLLYCPRCETPISNFEVAMDNSYKEVTEEAVTVKFQITNNKSQINSKFQIPNSKTYLLAWTTTPWTLPGNVALAVGEDIDYVKVKVGEEFYIVARSAPIHRLELINQHATDTFKGSDLIGLEYEPLFDVAEVAKSDKSFRVYAADFVNTEDGTGIVHTAVVYGEDDYNLGLKEGLPVVPLLDEKGIFNDQAPSLIRGKYFKDSERLVKQDLEKRGLMFEKKSHTHSYPHCWRCGTTLFYNAIPAWFMDIQKIKSGLLETNDKQINWYPDHLKHGRYQKSVEAAPDWNISRNRYWGNPIPVWRCDDKNCGDITVVGSIKELGLSRNVFLFSRHGEADHNLKDVWSCYPEKFVNNLTSKGVERAKGLAQWIEQNGGVDMIFASDLTRTRETAENVGKLLDVPVQLDPRLREFQVGVYNGRPGYEFRQDFPYEKLWTEHPEAGETNQQAQDRMVNFVTDINKRYDGKKILVVSHGDPLDLLMKYFGSELPYPKYANAFELDVSIADLHRPYIDNVVLECKKCGGKSHRISEIFDSWVEAGSMPFAEYHYPFDQKEIFERRFPAQFVSEYVPQTRAWFYVMHVMAYNLFGKAPFENVVTSGNILAEDGQKMSKSKNNFPDPQKVIQQYGVDSLRFYLMNSVVMLADDINFSERELGVVYRKNILILWNVFNYFVTYANESGYEDHLCSDKGDLRPMDQWILGKTQELVNTVTTQLDGYNTVKATRAIEEYINELSTWYLRRSRGRKDSHFFGTLRHCLLVLSKVTAPIMPYISELIYQNLNRNEQVQSVHLAKWPEKKELTEEQRLLLLDMTLVRGLATIGLMRRKVENIKLRQPLNKAWYGIKDKNQKNQSKKINFAYKDEMEKILASELNVKSIEFNIDKSVGETPDVEGLFMMVDFDWEISKDLLLEGLARELERAVQEMRKNTGLKVGEMANLSYDTEDEELIAAFDLFDTKKTYIAKILQKTGGEVAQIDSKTIRLKLG